MLTYTPTQEFIYVHLCGVILSVFALHIVECLFLPAYRKKEIIHTISTIQKSGILHLIGTMAVLCTIIEVICRGCIFGYICIHTFQFSYLVSNVIQSLLYVIVICFIQQSPLSYTNITLTDYIFYITYEWMTSMIFGMIYYFTGTLFIPILVGIIMNIKGIYVD